MEVTALDEYELESGLPDEFSQLIRRVLPRVTRMRKTEHPIDQGGMGVTAECQPHAVLRRRGIRRRKQQQSSRSEDSACFSEGAERIVAEVLEYFREKSNVECLVGEGVRDLL